MSLNELADACLQERTRLNSELITHRRQKYQHVYIIKRQQINLKKQCKLDIYGPFSSLGYARSCIRKGYLKDSKLPYQYKISLIPSNILDDNQILNLDKLVKMK